MASPKPDLESYLLYGIDEKRRRIYFGAALNSAIDDSESVTGFHETSVEYSIRAIERMAADHPKVPIELHMLSYGGDVYAMLALLDTIQSCSCQIKFYGRGIIASAATWIMAACDERFLYPNTTVLVHDISSDFPHSRNVDQEIEMAENKKLKAKLCEIYAQNSKMPKEFWEEISKRDLYLTAEEAIALGIADKIFPPKKRGNLRKVRQAHLATPVNLEKMNKLVEKLFKRVQVHDKLTLIIHEPKVEKIDPTLEPEALKVDTDGLE
jgi:ATP-dependent Clp protease protease subunit